MTASKAPDFNTQQGTVPRHVAIIMDGNNRWARERGLKGVEGHRAGAETVKSTVESCAKAGVEALTVFAFSSENWRRPDDEVNALMELFMDALEREVPKLHENGIRLQFVGDLSGFSDSLRSRMQQAMTLTQNNQRMHFAVAVNYGGRWDIVNTAKTLAQRVAQGELAVADIDESLFDRTISLGDLPPPDLCIRTAGDQRISNFLLWQLAYAELYFTETYWPDFDETALKQAFTNYTERQRRFGRTSEQIQSLSNSKDQQSEDDDRA